MTRPSKSYSRSKLLAGLPTSLQLFTVAEVAIIFGVEIHLVNEWINDGKLPCLRVGRGKIFTRVRAQDLETFIDTQIRAGKVNVPNKK